MERIKRTKEGFVLALGESTGHYHAIAEEVDLFDDGNVKFMTTFSPVTIKHQEHKPLTIETPGDYVIDIVQEQNHFKNLAEKVKD